MPPTHTMPESFRAALTAALARPLLLEPRALDPVRAAAGFRPRADAGETSPEAPTTHERDGDVAVVRVSGPLSQRAWSCWMFEGDGYDAIVKRADAAFRDPQARGVLLRLDSPGGEVAGCFDAVRTLRAMSAQYGKPLVAYVDEMACSAAYALASAAREIVVPDTGIVGSIGVILAVESHAGALEQEGVSVALITSGDAKADGHPAVALSDDARARLQADVDLLAGVFAAEVAASRPLTAPEVLGLQARTFIGREAERSGLADHVGSYAVALERARTLATTTTRRSPMSLLALLGAATEADAALAVTSLLNLRAQVRAATGTETDDASIGALHALKRDAADAQALRAQVEADRAAAATRERSALLDQAVSGMKLTPAERAADGTPEAWTTALSNDALRAFVGRAVAPTAAPKPPSGPVAQSGGLTDEQKAIADMVGISHDDYAKALSAQG